MHFLDAAMERIPGDAAAEPLLERIHDLLARVQIGLPDVDRREPIAGGECLDEAHVLGVHACRGARGGIGGRIRRRRRGLEPFDPSDDGKLLYRLTAEQREPAQIAARALTVAAAIEGTAHRELRRALRLVLRYAG